MSGLRTRALISKELTDQAPAQPSVRVAIVDMAEGEQLGHLLPSIIDDQMAVETVKPPHRGVPAWSQAVNDWVAVKTAMVAYRNGGGIDPGEISGLDPSCVDRSLQRNRERWMSSSKRESLTKRGKSRRRTPQTWQQS